MTHTPAPTRYDTMPYRLCGKSGLKLPAISLGLWQNFGEDKPFATQQAIVHRAFDLGITHFDLANNYGPPIGQAEITFGNILRNGLGAYRSELIVSTKAGYRARSGPYGDGGSRKNIITSCDDSLKRTGLDYFDIFYHHRQDTEVPVEESMGALDTLVRQGKVLYIGVSSTTGERYVESAEAIKANGLTRITSFMSRYNLLQREDDTMKWPLVEPYGAGGVAFCPLAMGLLTNKYIGNAPSAGSRLYNDLQTVWTLNSLGRVRALNDIALLRGQTLAQMSLAWLIAQPAICSALIGASSVAQLDENIRAIDNLEFSVEELAAIDKITVGFPNY